MKENLASYVENKIFEDIEEYNLNGEKSKIIDLLYSDDIDSIYPLLEKLDYESQCDILVYIMEVSYNADIVDNTTKIGALLSKYKTTLDEIYTEDDEDTFDDFEEYEDFDDINIFDSDFEDEDDEDDEDEF